MADAFTPATVEGHPIYWDKQMKHAANWGGINRAAHPFWHSSRPRARRLWVLEESGEVIDIPQCQEGERYALVPEEILRKQDEERTLTWRKLRQMDGDSFKHYNKSLDPHLMAWQQQQQLIAAQEAQAAQAAEQMYWHDWSLDLETPGGGTNE